jgi:holo-[acyl-carrier protein] synthase
VIYSIGTDIIDVSRIKRAIERNERFVEKIYTDNEISYCMSKANKYESFAARFAAKEAVMKAIGTGWDGYINWMDIEVLNTDMGKPYIVTYNATSDFVKAHSISRIHLSISHERNYALAYAILEC